MTRDTDHEARRGRKPSLKLPSRERVTTKPRGPQSAHAGERIAKVMARAGLCSRRDAELWIAEGRVAVNGEVLDSPARNVTDQDHITVNGAPLAQRERTRLFLFNKPRGLVTTDKDPEGRPTIFEALPEDMPRVVSIGRLDINTEGLLLLTNDGGLARVLELPATGWLRRYRVRAYGEADQSVLDRLAEGVTIDGVDYRGIEAKMDRMQGDNVWITMGLREGKNREIKRVLEHIGLQVNRLIRISYGPFQLGELGDGAIEEIRTRVLKDQLGEKLAEEAGADFDAPIFSPDADRARHRARDDGYDDRGSNDGIGLQEPAAPHSPERKRKHVSTLRDERAATAKAGTRRRITRDSTQDRHGRAVAVEHVKPAERPKSGKASTRNGRRFEAASGERPMRKRDPRADRVEAGPYVAGRGQGRDQGREEARGAGRGAPRGAARDGERGEARFERPSRSASGSSSRPGRPDRQAGDRPRPPSRSGGARDEGRPPRRDDAAAPRRFARSEERPRFDKRDGPRPERAPRGASSGEGRPRFARDGAEGGNRSFRSAPSGDRPRFDKRDGPRPERAPRGASSGEGRPRFARDGAEGGNRSFRGAPSGDRPRFEKRDGARPDRPPRGEGRPGFSRDGDRPRSGKPAGDRPYGGKPSFGKPGGRPGGGRPSGGRPGGKPGGRPGGKPGGRPPRDKH